MDASERTGAGSITRALRAREDGDAEATTRLYHLVQEELRAQAERHRARRAPAAWEPTELVDAVFVRLVRSSRVRFEDRRHFFAIAATSMRRIATDWARRALAHKRGGGRPTTTIEEPIPAPGGVDPELVLDVDLLLARLRGRNARFARVVEMRFFAGMTLREIAGALDVSERTVAGDWEFARTWLYARLRG